jgi:outer membrane protein TolC
MLRTPFIFSTFSFVFSLSWLCCAPDFLMAQNSEVLRQYIAEGLRNNIQVQQRDLDLRQAQESVRQAKTFFYPTAQFRADYTLAAGGRRLAFPIGDIINPIYSNLNAINKQLAPGSPLYPTDVPNVNETFLPTNFHNTKVTFAYPLYNTDRRYNLEIQQSLQRSQLAQKAVAEHELTYSITVAYLQYLKAWEAEKIWLSTRQVLQELRRFNEALVRNNVATREGIATADYEISKADYEIFQLRSARTNARAYLNSLLHRDLQSAVVLDTSLLKAPPFVFDSAGLVGQAWAQRPEFSALQSGMTAAETAVRLQKAQQNRPRAFIGGETGFQGFGYHFREQGYVLAQAGLIYDLYDHGLRSSKTQQARIQAEKVRLQYDAAKEQIALQVTTAWNAYTTAQQAFQTTQAGLNAATGIFKIVNNKYRAGQALLLEYLDAQNRVTTATLQQLLAWTEVLVREAEVRKAIGQSAR